MHIIGEVKSGYTNDKTGLFTPVQTQKNLVVYNAADVMAALLSGQPGYAPSYMYFEYANTNSAYTASAFDRTAGATYYQNFTGTDGSSVAIDYIRVPIISTPKIFQSPSGSANYNGNAVYFNTTSAAVGGVGSIVGQSPLHHYFSASGANGPSVIYAAALVSAPNPAHPGSDLVFSRLNLGTPLTVLSGSQPTLYWSLRFS